MAADSAITVSTKTTNSSGQEIFLVSNSYFTGEKVFSLGKSLPVGIATCGRTSIGSKPVSNLVRDFGLRMSGDPDFMDLANYTIEGIAEALKQFIFDEYYAMSEEKDERDLVFVIGGYSTNASLPEAWKLVIKGDQRCDLNEKLPGQQVGVFWAGEAEVVFRIIYGYGSKLQQVLEDAGIEEKQLKIIMDKCRSVLRVEMAPGQMPMNDAAQLALFLIETIKWSIKFTGGLQVVGGPTDVAMITKHGGFCWVRKKDPFSILNCM